MRWTLRLARPGRYPGAWPGGRRQPDRGAAVGARLASGCAAGAIEMTPGAQPDQLSAEVLQAIFRRRKQPSKWELALMWHYQIGWLCRFFKNFDLCGLTMTPSVGFVIVLTGAAT